MADFNDAFNTTDYNSNDDKNEMDFFFTQRKVVEYDEYIDENMNRKKKKKTTNYNFLALNLPLSKYNKMEYDINIEIWGDKGYNYKGKLCQNSGTLPHLLIRLSGDTQIFIKIIVSNNKTNENSISLINFIQVPKRYQEEPILKKEKKES